VRALGRAVDAQAAGARYTVVLVGQPLGPTSALGDPLPGKLLDEVLDVFAADAGATRGWARRQPLIVPDVGADPTWRALADGSDVDALWASPIETAGGTEVVGASVLHFDRPRVPDAFDRQLLEAAAHLAHIAIEGATTQARLVHQASHDPLTGLPNRRLFLDRTAMALTRLPRSGRVVAVLFIDLDRFKSINDSLGHDAGDQLLIELGERIRQVVRPSDTVSRFGGDEFTILCEDIHDPDEAMAIAARVRDALAEPVHLDGREIYVTASVGITHTTDPSRRPQELVDDADAAMYRSKEAGGNLHQVYDPAMRRQARGEWATAQALRQALDRGELRVYYQPTVSLRTGRVLGAEALVRWEHPEHGTIEPGRFIGLAERTGLIVPIGRLVLGQACQRIRWWQEQVGEGFTMSVNLSARQFADPSLTATVGAALHHAGAPASALSLEITESVLMENAESTMASLRELKDLGVGLAIDDFGTGYSSFSYLKRFPVDVIKVDRTFVSGLGHDPNDEAIVGAVVSLAGTLGMTTVAEGVETAEQVKMLQALGCGIAQGFYFSRAAPPESFGSSLPTWDV
jgi:diguanylate cyclase (GGDEF)-like protein